MTNQLSILDRVRMAWWVGDRSYTFWEAAKDTPYDYVRRMATVSRARGIVAHDRVLNIKQHMRRGV
jgi:hypothetical protein